MKIELINNQNTQIFEDKALFPITINSLTKINNLDPNTYVIELDCSLIETMEIIKTFKKITLNRYEDFRKYSSSYIDELDKSTGKILPRYLLVYKNIKDVPVELQNEILELWNISRASGISHIFVVEHENDLWEPIRSSNIKFND